MFNANYDIVIYLRDVNGRRVNLEFPILESIRGFDWTQIDDDNYEILMVLWEGQCIYCALTDEAICIEDLVGFFA